MSLEVRVSRLEKRAGKSEALMAIIGVPGSFEDLFGEAQRFWDKEKDNHPQGSVRDSVPWPSYIGDEVKFLGLGTLDDYYFGLCGGVRDFEGSRFVFLADVEHLIRVHWREVQVIMSIQKNDRDGLGISKESADILSSLVRSGKIS